jgi:hypothetical protein
MNDTKPTPLFTPIVSIFVADRREGSQVTTLTGVDPAKPAEDRNGIQHERG